MAGKRCRRLDGLCNLTEAQKTERDAKMRAWLNQRRIERVALATGVLPLTNFMRMVDRARQMGY